MLEIATNSVLFRERQRKQWEDFFFQRNYTPNEDHRGYLLLSISRADEKLFYLEAHRETLRFRASDTTLILWGADGKFVIAPDYTGKLALWYIPRRTNRFLAQVMWRLYPRIFVRNAADPVTSY